jgi:hypothetical protein
MQFSVATLVALLSATALAVPTPAASVSGEIDARAGAPPRWVIKNMKRACDAADTSCRWSFLINNGPGDTSCDYTVYRAGVAPASQSPNHGVTCSSSHGTFTVSSSWSGQFGPNAGFTTFAIANQAARRIAYPAYQDTQLANGQVVKPDIEPAVNAF